MLGLVLSKDAGKQLSQEDVRTYVLSKMVDMPDEPSNEEPQSPGSLIAHGLSPRLNVVFDVDHTLIYACDKKESRVLPGTVRNTHLLRLNSGFEMMLVVREGIYEMFDFLEPFCTFYVYSHGLKEYIDKILTIIDPDMKWFKNRGERVLAPIDNHQQLLWKQRGKSFLDFRCENDKSKALFSQAELSRAIVIDDQFLAIKSTERVCMIQSKKFLKYFDCLVTKQKQIECKAYQYPVRMPEECQVFVNTADDSFSFFVSIDVLNS